MHGGQHHPAPSDEGGVHAQPGRSRPSRRRALPSGRAVVGGLLVALSMLVVFVAASGAGRRPEGRAVVADRSLPIGHRVEAADLRVEAVEVPDDSAARLFTSTEALVGAVTTAALAPGELVDRSAVVAADGRAAGSRELSFPVDRERAVDGRLRPGEMIDLLATFGTGDGAHTEVVARGVRLLDIDEAGKATLGSTGRLVVTVALADDADVIEATRASEVAHVTLVRSAGEAP